MYTAKGQLDVSSMLKQYSPLVRRLAHQMIAKLPANVEIDDLIQVGMIGLTDALSRFDAAQGVQFETFATQRIRGAMLDELRGNDYLSRGTRKQQRSIEAAVHKLEQRLGRAPAESEIAREMGITLAEYQELLGKVRGTQLVYLEDMSGDEGDSDYMDRHVGDEAGLQPSERRAAPGREDDDRHDPAAQCVRDERLGECVAVDAQKVGGRFHGQAGRENMVFDVAPSVNWPWCVCWLSHLCLLVLCSVTQYSSPSSQ